MIALIALCAWQGGGEERNTRPAGDVRRREPQETVKAAGEEEEGIGEMPIPPELKKLSPEELIRHGAKCCREESEVEKGDGVEIYMTTYIILSYHAKKVGWDETACRVAEEIRRSDNPLWIECCRAWITANDNHTRIGSRGMGAIGRAIAAVVSDTKKSSKTRCEVLRWIGGPLWLALPAAEKKKIRKAVEAVCKAPGDAAVRKGAEWARYEIEYTEWDDRRERGLPVGPRPENPHERARRLWREKVARMRKTLGPFEFVDEKGKKRSMLDYKSYGEIPSVAFETLNRERTIPALVKMLEEEKDPKKVTFVVDILRCLQAREAIPVLAAQIKTKYSGKVEFAQIECCRQMISCMAVLARRYDEAYGYLKKFLQHEYWHDVKWWLRGSSKESVGKLLVFSAIVEFPACERVEGIEILEKLARDKRYADRKNMMIYIQYGIKELKKVKERRQGGAERK